MTPTIVFLDAATIGGDVSLDPIRALGRLTTYPTTRTEERISRIGDAQVVITNKVCIDREVLEACPSVRLICEAATGLDNIDLQEAQRRGVEVRNVAAYSTESVVQTTLSLVLHLLMNVAHWTRYVQDGSYTRSNLFTCVERPFAELAGKQWGIVGMGTIGKRVAAVAEALGCRVAYYSTSGKNDSAPQYARMELADLLRTSDVVSIHAPLNDRTRGLIRLDQLRLMRPTALLVNMGRGAIVDESALAAAVDEGLIAGAGTDVFSAEPLPTTHPYLHMQHPERMALTPHIGWASREARERLVSRMADNIRDFLQTV